MVFLRLLVAALLYIPPPPVSPRRQALPLTVQLVSVAVPALTMPPPHRWRCCR